MFSFCPRKLERMSDGKGLSENLPAVRDSRTSVLPSVQLAADQASQHTEYRGTPDIYHK